MVRNYKYQRTVPPFRKAGEIHGKTQCGGFLQIRIFGDSKCQIYKKIGTHKHRDEQR